MEREACEGSPWLGWGGMLAGGIVRYKAFMSYSHAGDGRLAPAVQRALHRFAKPWYGLRAMKVFRDQTSLSATPELWPSIEAALTQSEHFLLFASPEAAASKWVGQEVSWWLENRSVARLILLVSDGELAWEEGRDGWDWSRTTCLPERLRGAFEHEPLWVDLRWARDDRDLSLRHSRFRATVLDIAAPLHGKEKDELDGEDVAQHRRFRLVAAVVGALLVVLTVLAVYAANRAIRNAREAERQRRAAVSRQLAAQSSGLADRRLDQALLLAIQATRVTETVEARRSLLAALRLRRSPRGFLRHGSGPVQGIAHSPDGTLLATGSPDGVALWDVPSLESIPLEGGEEIGARRLAFSEDSRWLTAVDAEGVVRRWDLASGQLLPPLETGHQARWPPAFSLNGRRLLTGVRPEEFSVWELGERVAWPTDPPDTVSGMPTSAALDARGERVALGTEAGGGMAWEVAGGSRLARFYVDDEVDVTGVAFAPDGRRLAVGGRNGAIMVESLEEPRPPTPLPAASGRVEELVFGPGGRTLLSRDGGGRVSLWSLSGERPSALPLRGFAAAAASQDFGSRDAQIAVGGAAGAVALWELGGTATTAPFELGGGASWRDFAFAPGGGELVAVDRGGTVRRWRLPDLESLGEAWSAPGGQSHGLAVGADGTLVALADGRGGAVVVTAATGEIVRELTVADGPGEEQPRWLAPSAFVPGRRAPGVPGSLAFSPDGAELAVESAEGRIQLWGLSGSGPVVLEAPKAMDFHPTWERARLAWARDGVLVAGYTAPGASMLAIWDTAARALLGEPLHAATDLRAVKSVAEYAAEGEALSVSADGGLLAAGSFGATVRVWDLSASPPRSEAMEGSVQDASSLALSPDASLLAVAEPAASGVRLWDPAAGRELGQIGDVASRAERLAFSPDGRWLAALELGRLLIWEVGFDAWRERACRLANRNLTPAEWAEYLGGETPCERVCPGVPAEPGCSAETSY